MNGKSIETANDVCDQATTDTHQRSRGADDKPVAPHAVEIGPAPEAPLISKTVLLPNTCHALARERSYRRSVRRVSETARSGSYPLRRELRHCKRDRITRSGEAGHLVTRPRTKETPNYVLGQRDRAKSIDLGRSRDRFHSDGVMACAAADNG
jgi:hypothetical protein